MPVPVTTQYGSLRIPDGYIPPSVNPPVVPQHAASPTNDWRRPSHSQYHPHHPSQSHHRMPSQSHPPFQPVNPGVIPPRPFPEPVSSSPTSTFSSPPFKPFQPLPEIRRHRPPTPPPKLLDITPYRDTFSYLSHPSPGSKSRALEIIQNRERTNVHKAHEEWRRQDEERERAIKEKKEERERLVSGANTITAPTMQTVTALVVDPTNIQQPIPPPPPPKEKRPFWRRLFHPNRPGQSQIQSRQQTAVTIPAQPSGPVMIPLGAQQAITSIPGVVVPVQIASQSQTQTQTQSHSQSQSHTQSQSQSSSSSSQQSSGGTSETVQGTPVIPASSRSRFASGGAAGPHMAFPSPFGYPDGRSTTPDVRPPPTAAFFSIPTPVNM